MKHLRLFSLILLVVLATAWAPLPRTLAATLPAPSLVSPASGAFVTGYQPTFTWKPIATTPDSYTLQLSFDSAMKNPAKEIVTVTDIPTTVTGGVVSYTFSTDVPSNAKIYWRVWAVKAGDTATKSSIRYIKTNPLPVASGVTIPSEGETVNSLRPTIDWDPVERITGYEVWLLLNGVVKGKYSTTTDSYTFAADLLRSTTYQVQVRSKSIHGSTVNSPWTPLRSFTTPNPPGVPKPLTPKTGTVLAAGLYTPTLTWTEGVSPLGHDVNYILQFATSSTFKDGTIYRTVEGITDPTYNFTDPVGEPLPTGTYYWRVRSVDAVDQSMSNWSTALYFKTQPAMVVLVRDYLTKSPIEAASVTVTGFATPFTTGADGLVNTGELTAGSKTVTVSKADYVTKKVAVAVSAGGVKNVTVELVHIPIKYVLTWKNTLNLDLHLWIPEAYQTDGRGHIHWAYRGSTTKAPYAAISTNDTNGYGPETITIQNRYPGAYKLAVFNFNKNLALKDSGAEVKIYYGSQLLQTVKVLDAGGASGVWWMIPEVNGSTGVFTNNNQLYGLSDFPWPYDKDGGTFAAPEQ